MPPAESLRHKEAFEFYYLLGHKGRSYEKVAKKFQVSMTTVGKWSKRYGWQERIMLRDKEIGKAVESQTIGSIVDEKAWMMNILKSQLADVVKTDHSGNLRVSINIRNQEDLVKTVKTMLELLGEAGSEQNIKFEIISALPRPKDKE